MYGNDYNNPGAYGGEDGRERRRWPLVVGGFLAAVVVLVGAAAIYASTHDDSNGGGGGKPNAQPSQSYGVNTDPPRAPGIVGGFADVTYKNLYGLKLPYSPTLGPKVTTGGLASGFSHDQSGAVIASIHLLTRSSGTVGPAIYTPTITKQWLGTAANKRLMLSAAAEDYRSFAPNGGVPGPVDSPVYIGYSFSSEVSDDDMSVSLLVRLTLPDQSHALFQQTVHAVWSVGDWRLVALPGRPVQLAAAQPGTAALPGQDLALNPPGR